MHLPQDVATETFGTNVGLRLASPPGGSKNRRQMSLSRTFAPVASLLLIAVATLSGCAVTPDEEVAQSEDGLTTYDDLFSTLEGSDLDRWVTVRSALKSGFDRICGDTICGGDYSNLSTVRIACSSTSKARKMKDCAWVLGGSIEHVDGRTGKITSAPRVFTCKIPVAGSAKAMLSTLEAAGDDALSTPLPGTGKSFYDGLVDCFDGVVGGPLPPEPAKTFYAELGDWSWAHADGSAWSQTTRRLAEGFDEICGDSFCEGDYPDITPLRFACSVNLNTKRVSRCTWSFAAAELSVGAGGKIDARTTTKSCTIEIGAQASALASALSGSAPLNATLPGKTTSIYDALIGCL